MSETYPYHLFGHQNGQYETMTALGLADREAKALEQFIFGQTNDERYLASLTNDPGVIWRAVGERFALTRVRRGRKDSNGRATLLFETILLSLERVHAAAKRLEEIVLGKWETTPNGVTVSPAPTANDRTLHADKVSDVLMTVRSGQRVTRRAEGFSLRDVTKIVSSCVTDPDFGLCYKSLNKAAPMTVNLVSQDVPETNVAESRPASTPKSAPAQVATASSTPKAAGLTFVALAMYVALALQLLIVWLAAKSPGSSGTPDAMQKHIIDRIVSVDTDQTKRLTEATESIRNSIDKIDKSLAGHIQSIDNELRAQLKKDHDSLVNEMSEIAKQVRLAHTITQSLEKNLSETTSRMSQNVESLDKRIKELDDRVKSLDAQVKDNDKHVGSLVTWLDEHLKSMDLVLARMDEVLENIRKKAGAEKAKQ